MLSNTLLFFDAPRNRDSHFFPFLLLARYPVDIMASSHSDFPRFPIAEMDSPCELRKEHQNRGFFVNA